MTAPGEHEAGGNGVPDVARNLARVRERIRRAALSAGRDPEDVALVAVTKGVPADLVRVALSAGVAELGENRVQEGQAKRAELGVEFPSTKWHLIGHLQTNKALRAVSTFELIHSIDSQRVAGALSAAAARAGVPSVSVLVQVNVSGEDTKFGVRPPEVENVVKTVCGMPGLRVAGLMTMAPFSADPEDARPFFRKLAELARSLSRRRDLAGAGGRASFDILSMGMSGDFEVAVAEGSTLVRIGTAIFGPRGG